jgi:hypothetical protein|tara:strand:+ start:1024 stop:1299 length:276 start_codon:yes stop_codon:yes gene_type:complete
MPPQKDLIEYDAHERILRAVDAIHKRSILQGEAEAKADNKGILKHSGKISDHKLKVIRAIGDIKQKDILHKFDLAAAETKLVANKSKRWYH